MKIVLCLLSIQFGITVVNGQADVTIQNFKQLSNVIPPAPNAAALAKFAEIPVNGHTGIPQISVPIFDWRSKRGNASLSIGLSYHAGGIKVEDVAPSTGLGWSLNADGMITRSVRGLPDDIGTGFINTPILPNYYTSMYDGGYYLNPPVPADEFASMDTSRLKIIGPFNDYDQRFSNSLSNGELDGEQDIFYYNIAGYSGKFVLDKDGNVNKIEENDLLITVQYSPYFSIKVINAFVIQADNGIKYILDVKENSEATTYSSTIGYKYFGIPVQSSVNQPISTNFISTFRVSRAIDLNSKDTINYKYDLRTNQYYGGWNESVEYHDNNDPEIFSISGIQTDHKIKSQSFSYTFNKINVQSIAKISLPDSTSIAFFYDDERLDLANDRSLNRIEVKDVLSNTIRYKLSYTYLNADSINSNEVLSLNSYSVNAIPGYSFTRDHFYKRLKLDRIDQVTTWQNGDSICYREFKYSPIKLPPRVSKAIDFWGYYYGPIRNPFSLIPQTEPVIPETILAEGLQPPIGHTGWLLNAFTEGADRTPDENYCKAGVLNRIILPTGGYTAFNFEANTIKGSLYFNSATRSTAFIASISSRVSSEPVDLLLPGQVNEQVLFYIAYKRVNQDGTLFVPPTTNGGPVVCFNDAIANSEITVFVKSTDNSINKQCNFKAVPQGESFAKVYFALPAGKNYKVYFKYNSNNDPCLANVYFNLDITTKFWINAASSVAGGIRVRSIQHVDTSAINAITKEYVYNDSNNVSTGILPVLPNYEKHVHAIGKWTQDSYGWPVWLGYAKFKIRSSNSAQTLGYCQGGNVGYLKVNNRSVNAQGATLGKTETYFSGIELRNNYTIFPYKVNQLIDWASGNLLKEITYDAQNKRQNEVENLYQNTISVVNNDKNRSIKIGNIRTDNQANNSPLYSRFVATAYYPYNGKSLLVKKIERSFAGNDSLITSTSYQYNGLKLKSKTIKLSSNTNENIRTEYFYPEEYSHVALQKLVANSVKNTPVGSRVTRFNSQINGAIREVGGEGVDYSVIGNYAKPTLFSTHTGVNPTNMSLFQVGQVKRTNDQVSGEITKYDAAGNACEFKGKDGVLTAIIWGYGYSLPIIKVTGAGYQESIDKLASTSATGLQSVFNAATLRGIFMEVKNGFASNSNVQVTGSTYAPLFGITSQTDPNGLTTFYEYDGFGRLKRIKDHTGNTIKHFDYQYQKPITQ